ncbi:MAG: two-component regulator propeller domain-containing protein, partial [Sphingomonadaceae bacterium]
MRTFFSPSAVAGRRQPARLTFAVLLALGASPCQGFAAPEPATNPWHGLAPAMFEHLVPADKAFPGPSAMTLAQDPDGFMWIGTQGGLGRWDGYHMRNFIHSPDDPASLPGDFIQTLHVDGQGRLWVGTTTDGVALYDKLTERFVRYPAGPNGLSSPAVNAIVSDAQGRIWIGTAAGLDYIDTAHGNQVRHVRRPPEAGAGANQIRALYVDVHGNLWVGSNAGLARRDPASGRFDDVALGEGVKDAVLALAGDAHGEVVFGTLKNGVGLARLTAGVVQARILALDPVKDAQNAMVLSLCEIVPGQWWAATYGGGIIEFDTSGRSRRIVHRPAIPTSLSIDRVAAVWRERSGLVWVAHERGVDIHNPLNRTVDTVHDGAGLPEISATTFMTDTAGRLWVGLAEQGVDVIGPDGTRTAALRPDPAQPETALPSRLVLAIAEAEPQEAWIGTLLGLYHTSARGTKVRRVPLPHTDAYPRIGSILREDQQLWLGTANGLLRFDPQANTVRVYGAGLASSGGLTDGRITTMLRGPDNALWVATRNGLNRIDTSSGAVEHMLPMAGVPTALKQGFINSMAFDRKGRLWLGTLSAGVAILHGRTPDGARRFLHLGEEAGLPGGRINGISADAAGRMWASTSDGIIVIDPATLRAQLLGRPEGVVFQSYYAGAVGQTASADIVFGTSGGFAVVHPEPPERWRYQAPLVVSTVRLDRNTVAAAPLLVPGGPGLRIPAGTRSVEIEVAALDYSASQRNRYAFRLDGYDRDWVETDANRRVATYANVAPGRYLLHMRGSNRDGVWSPHELTMELHFLPAWYQTWWARSGAGLLALAFGWGLYRWRVRQLRHTQAMLQQQVYLRTLHLEKVHAIVKSINEQLDFDALLQTILTESGSIGQVRLATAWVGQGADGPLSPRAVWQRAPHALLQPELSRAEAHAQLVAAADAVAPDMFLSREGRVLTVRISIAQQ